MVRCKHLPMPDWLSGADPFVTLILGERKAATRVKWGTVNPWWANEEAEFAPLEEFTSHTLHIAVADYNRLSPNVPLGGAELDLDTVPYNREVEFELPLKGEGGGGSVVIKVRKALSASEMDTSKLDAEDRLVHSVALAREHWATILEEMRLALAKRKAARRKALKGGRKARSNLLHLSKAFMALHESYAILLLRFNKVSLELAKAADLKASAQRRAALQAVARGEGLTDDDEGEEEEEDVEEVGEEGLEVLA